MADDDIRTYEFKSKNGNFPCVFDPVTGTMTISGEGVLTLNRPNSNDNYQYNSEALPWRKEPVRHLIIENGITGFPRYMFAEMPELESAVLPDTYYGENEGFEFHLFKDCLKLKTVPLPAGLIEIGNGMFQGCVSLETDENMFPTTLKKIKQYAFEGCTSLRKLVLPEGVTSIYEGAFANTGIEEITIPNTVTNIRTSFLSSPNLTAEGIHWGGRQ